MKCPGQDMQYWNTEAIFEVKCPQCGKPVEFYKDDTNRRCHHCNARFVNPKMDFGCAAYCQYAEQCLGTLPDEFVGAQDNLLKDKVAVEMKRFFQSDFSSIGHATRVARYAEAIGKSEGGNLAVILCAAYLHGVGSGSSPDTEKNHTTVARDILTRLKAKEAMTEAVCSLLEQQDTAVDNSSLEEQILADAKHLALLEETYKQHGNTTHETAEHIQAQIQTGEGTKQSRIIIEKYTG